MMQNPTGHPARFSEEIINVLKTMIEPTDHVHDPFAGTGERMGALADEIGCRFTGTEIERQFIVDRRVKFGNSMVRQSYPRGRWIGVTSPVYPNGNADYFASSENEAKPWKRNTYRHAIAKLTKGSQTELATYNMARYGYRGTDREGRSVKRERYWDIARKVASKWNTAEFFILNTSDFYSVDLIEPLTQDWIDLMVSLGWTVDEHQRVSTPRYRHGSDESRDLRVEHEDVIRFVH